MNVNEPVRFVVPGKPHSQKRGKIVKRGKFYGIADQDESVEWKGVAQVHLMEAMGDRPPFPPYEPLSVEILAVFACPRGDYRKRQPRPRRFHTKRGDVDNIAKACLDACSGVLWHDDAQVAELLVHKVIGAQGELPRVEITAWQLEEES